MATNRRTFLKQSSIAAAAGALSTLAPAVHAAGDDVIKIGLVGCGGRGTGAGAQSLSTGGRTRLVAVADAFKDPIEGSLSAIRNAAKSQKNAEVAVDDEHKFVGFDAYKQVIDSDIDVVVIATPPGFRPYHFAYAVEKGKHVFMEKPVATDSTGVRMVLDNAKKAKDKGLKVGVGLQRRHNPVYLELVKRIHDGAIGNILASQVYWNSGGVWDPKKNRDQVKNEMEYQMWNWYYYNWLCGDHINEQHIHNLDIGNWVKNAFPVSANGMGGRQVRTDKKYGEIFDHFAVEYTYADGSKMFSQCRHIHNTWNAVEEHGHGTKGTFHLHDGGKRGCALELADGTKITSELDRGDPYQIEHDDLQKAIRDNKEYSEAEYGAMSTMTAILGRMVTYSGKVIKMEDALKSEKSIMPKSFSFDADPPTKPNAEGEYPIPMPGKTEVL
jgi:myo-inositol 2-dehydrogenase/D-chiro-inositol 1-dehydrogenase